MKKLFISCPMRGRTDEQIHKSMEKMHRIAEAVFGEELEVIPTFIPVSTGEQKAVSLLGESIKLMSLADYYIGISWKDAPRGCFCENTVASKYGIDTYLVGLRIAAPDMVNKF